MLLIFINDKKIISNINFYLNKNTDFFALYAELFKKGGNVLNLIHSQDKGQGALSLGLIETV